MNFRFEANIFISAPYVRCDACSQEQFGVFSVGPYTYVRQCRACRHRSDGIPLPALSRKVIYVDQFAISNMMKALNRHHPRHEAAAGDPFWRRLFERLDRLIKLQLAICPFVRVNPLGLQITYFRVDQAFEETRR